MAEYVLGGILVGACGLLGTFMIPGLCLYVVIRLDREERIELGKREKAILMRACPAAGFLVCYVIFFLNRPEITKGWLLTRDWEGFVRLARECLLLGMIGGCLLFACITDLQIKKVYGFTWWIGAAAGILLFKSTQAYASLIWVVIFVLLQELFFEGFYGRADCHAFCICALAQGALGLKLKAYLIHMASALLLLTVIQGIKHNIGKDGNLKEPVPFLPYITTALGILFTFYPLIFD